MIGSLSKDFETGDATEGIDFTLETTVIYVHDPELKYWHSVDTTLKRMLTMKEIQLEKKFEAGQLTKSKMKKRMKRIRKAIHGA